MLFNRRPPALPPRHFPLLLRREWRCDCPARKGRLRAFAFIATCPTFKWPAPYGIAAE